MPSGMEVLIATVDGTLGIIGVPAPSGGFVVGNGYQVNFVNDSQHLSAILAQSPQFSITQSNTTTSTTAAPSNAAYVFFFVPWRPLWALRLPTLLTRFVQHGSRLQSFADGQFWRSKPDRLGFKRHDPGYERCRSHHRGRQHRPNLCCACCLFPMKNCSLSSTFIDTEGSFFYFFSLRRSFLGMTVPEDCWIDDFTLLAYVSFFRICNGHHTYSSYIFKSPQYLTVSPELESDWGSDTRF